MDRVHLFCLFCLLSVPVAADPVVSVDASGFVPFNRLDSDGNGYVSRIEARIAAGIRDAFDAADINRDGLLDRDEYPAVQAAAEVR
ncbi:MAG: hypothetical protein PVI28_13800 [Gammaproteobacteria bacterium]|jgi:hypothetical protein